MSWYHQSQTTQSILKQLKALENPTFSKPVHPTRSQQPFSVYQGPQSPAVEANSATPSKWCFSSYLVGCLVWSGMFIENF